MQDISTGRVIAAVQARRRGGLDIFCRGNLPKFVLQTSWRRRPEREVRYWLETVRRRARRQAVGYSAGGIAIYGNRRCSPWPHGTSGEKCISLSPSRMLSDVVDLDNIPAGQLCEPWLSPLLLEETVAAQPVTPCDSGPSLQSVIHTEVPGLQGTARHTYPFMRSHEVRRVVWQ